MQYVKTYSYNKKWLSFVVESGLLFSSFRFHYRLTAKTSILAYLFHNPILIFLLSVFQALPMYVARRVGGGAKPYFKERDILFSYSWRSSM
jgi:hypothetical protein